MTKSIPDFIDLGPEMFTTTDREVICWQGENFYRACGVFVHEDPIDGIQSHCVKRVNHPGKIHEDYHGNTRGNKEWLRFFGWWNPRNEKEEWYAQGWNNGSITTVVLMAILMTSIALLAMKGSG